MRKIFFILFLLICPCSWAAIRNASTCSAEDIATQVAASSDGDVIIVPSGSCSWTTPGAGSPALNITNKAITLQGAGIGNTTITDATGSGWMECALLIKTKPVRVTGFSFIGTSDTTNGLIRVENSGGVGLTGFRIDHCAFTLNVGYAIYTHSLSYGLIDNNTFLAPATDHTFIEVDADGDTSWSRASSLGTANAVYIEDNTFTSTPGGGSRIVYAQGGGRYVARYNTVYNMGIDSHGRCGDVGTFSYEIYNNTWSNASGKSMYRWMFIRGGSGVIYNNAMTNDGTLTRHIDMTEYRINSIDSCSGIFATCCTSYPCQDQIGRGTAQALDPLYIWDNTVNGSPSDISVNSVDSHTCDPDPLLVTDVIQLNRDYYTSGAKPGYSAYTYPHPLQGAGGDTTPPVTTITTPATPTYDNGAVSTITISGTGTDDTGVTSVTWSNDRGGSGTATCTGCTGVAVTWTMTVSLQSGDNVITVTSHDAAGNTGSDSVTVTYTPPVATGSGASGIRLRIKP